MKKVKTFFINLFYKTRHVTFSRDGKATHLVGVNDNIIIFWKLKKPVSLDSDLKNCESEKFSPVALHFYSTKSVDRFIERLNKIKENIQTMQLAEMLKQGGEIVFEWKADEEKKYEYDGHVVYSGEVRIDFTGDKNVNNG